MDPHIHCPSPRSMVLRQSKWNVEHIIPLCSQMRRRFSLGARERMVDLVTALRTTKYYLDAWKVSASSILCQLLLDMTSRRQFLQTAGCGCGVMANGISWVQETRRMCWSRLSSISIQMLSKCRVEVRFDFRFSLFPSNGSILLLSGFHSAAVGYNGALFTWGVGMYGALGHGDDTPSVVTEPCVVDMPASVQKVVLSSSRFIMHEH
jgi:hypothetical protein